MSQSVSSSLQEDFGWKNVDNDSLKDPYAVQAFKMMLIYVESVSLNLFVARCKRGSQVFKILAKGSVSLIILSQKKATSQRAVVEMEASLRSSLDLLQQKEARSADSGAMPPPRSLSAPAPANVESKLGIAEKQLQMEANLEEPPS